MDLPETRVQPQTSKKLISKLITFRSRECSRIPQSSKRNMATRPEASFQEAHRSPAAAVAAAIHDGKTHLLLAASGSVAVIKLPLIISAFENHSNLSIRVILTKSAACFLAGQSPEQPTV